MNSISTLSEPAVQVPCLMDGPIRNEALQFLEASDNLGVSQEATVLRAWCVALFFRRLEQIFESGMDPLPLTRELLSSTAQWLSAAKAWQCLELGSVSLPGTPASDEPVVEATGKHYGRLFRAFSETAFFDETLNLLTLRLVRNQIPFDTFRDRSLIDVGCGGGRYTCAWRRLGARPALGVDISPLNIEDARRRSEAHGLTETRFEAADVLRLPFEAGSFDVVFSNGVLHHTSDWRLGIEELVRVLRPGGFGWLYVIESPGGLFWDIIEILRRATCRDSRDLVQASLQAFGIPGNRVFYVLDHVMVPINIRLTPTQVEQALQGSGAVSVRRLERGTDFDRVEQIYQRKPFAEIKYGVGENRYVFSKL